MVYKIKVKGYEFLSKVLEHDIENDYRETEDKNKVYYYASDYRQVKKLFHPYKKEYKKLLRKISKELGLDFYYQKIPNFRYHKTDDEFHPFWHNDLQLNHLKGTLNIIIPITNKDFGFEIMNSFLSRILDKLPLKFNNLKLMQKIYSLLSKKINHLEDILVFDNYHLHTATNRKEYGTIRKSVDLRILPIDYDDTQNKKSLGGVEMKPGGYFSRRPISHE